MNYRKFYQEQTEVELPKDFDVHHIDGNRKNNDIMNLIALPSKLHHQYHFFQGSETEIKEIEFNINVNPQSYFYTINQLTKLALVVSEMHKFLLYRNSLLNKDCINIYNYNYNTKVNI